MKIYALGTCSGTEPMVNRHHTSFAFELNDRLYFFDAGENCSYTAHLMGLDLLKVSDVFISHPHMDHIGGLPNLLWTIFKMTYVTGNLPKYGDVNIHISDKEIFDSVKIILENTQRTYNSRVNTQFKQIEEGIIYKDENITVSAVHNNHIKYDGNRWMSYSFLINAEDKRILYSGDIKELDDIHPFLKDGCDILFIETGHNSSENLCKEIVEKGYDVKKVYFMHHGRAILYNCEEELEKCRKIIPSVEFCNDKDIIIP